MRKLKPKTKTADPTSAAGGPAMGPRVELHSWSSVTICGAKGSGKTTLERYLVGLYPRSLVFDTLEEFPEIPLRHIPRTDDPGELDQVAARVLRMCNCALVVSEAEIYLPVQKPLPPNILKLVTRGRHYNCALVVDTRRIASLHKTVFSLSDHCVIFRHFSPTDIKYLGDFLPDAREVPQLANYEYIHYSQGVMFRHKPLQGVA